MRRYNRPNAMIRKKIGSDDDSDACVVELDLWSPWEGKKNREGSCYEYLYLYKLYT